MMPQFYLSIVVVNSWNCDAQTSLLTLKLSSYDELLVYVVYGYIILYFSCDVHLMWWRSKLMSTQIVLSHSTRESQGITFCEIRVFCQLFLLALFGNIASSYWSFNYKNCSRLGVVWHPSVGWFINQLDMMKIWLLQMTGVCGRSEWGHMFLPVTMLRNLLCVICILPHVTCIVRGFWGENVNEAVDLYNIHSVLVIIGMDVEM